MDIIWLVYVSGVCTLVPTTKVELFRKCLVFRAFEIAVYLGSYDLRM